MSSAEKPSSTATGGAVRSTEILVSTRTASLSAFPDIEHLASKDGYFTEIFTIFMLIVPSLSQEKQAAKSSSSARVSARPSPPRERGPSSKLPREPSMEALKSSSSAGTKGEAPPVPVRKEAQPAEAESPTRIAPVAEKRRMKKKMDSTATEKLSLSSSAAAVEDNRPKPEGQNYGTAEEYMRHTKKQALEERKMAAASVSKSSEEPIIAADTRDERVPHRREPPHELALEGRPSSFIAPSYAGEVDQNREAALQAEVDHLKDKIKLQKRELKLVEAKADRAMKHETASHALVQKYAPLQAENDNLRKQMAELRNLVGASGGVSPAPPPPSPSSKERGPSRIDMESLGAFTSEVAEMQSSMQSFAITCAFLSLSQGRCRTFFW